MMPNEAAAKPKEPDLLVQRDMVSYIYSHYSESINLDEIAAAEKSAATSAVRFSAVI